MNKKTLYLYGMVLLALLGASCTPLNSSAQPAPNLTEDVIPVPSTTPAGPDDGVGDLSPIVVEQVGIEIGVGSPIPVEVLVSGTWPGLCSQLARLEQHLDGSTFEITLMASPDTPGCPPDMVGLPFRIAVPLNMVEMELGAYTVRVNGVEATFEWQASPGVVDQQPAVAIVYVGWDGNLWKLGKPGEPLVQLTQDAASPVTGDPLPDQMVQYYHPILSSDGRMVAYNRDVGTPSGDGMSFQFGLWVTDLVTGESRQVLNEIAAGFSWKPNSHILVYGLGVAQGYFTIRGEVDQDLAQGIWGVDLDQEALQPVELVRPERGYSLVAPTWSPDGRFLAFDEVHLYEGRGMFAYYDLEGQEYISWEEAIGIYSWSADGAMIAYDRLTYMPNGEERIFLRERLSDDERLLSPDFEQGHAFNPVFSPQGDQIAYLAELTGLDSQTYTLFVQSLTGSAPIALGTFEAARSLNWTADGASLVFSAGPHGEQQVISVDVNDGGVTILSHGSEPALPR
jgi:Tol biopolymer transport system component